MCAYTYGGEVFLNPPQHPSQDENIVFELDMVFTKSIEEQRAEELIESLKPRLKSFFVLGGLPIPDMYFKSHVISKTS